jgi:beta-phosphoglucomutase family hydrolase
VKPYAAVIFDMDGVIVDSEPLHVRAFEEVFDQLGHGSDHGIHFPDFFGRSDRVVWESFIARHRPSQSLAELTHVKEQRYLELLHATQPIYPGVESLIRTLAANTPLGLASGSVHTMIEAVLALRGLRPLFRAVSSSQDVAHPKPAPDVFLHAAAGLGIAPEECVVIEDSAAGVAAARAAGMRVIAITNSLPADRLQAAHAIVSHYDELGKLLL